MLVPRFFLAGVLALTVVGSLATPLWAQEDTPPAQVNEPQTFAVEDMFSIGVPEGYSWELAAEAEVENVLMRTFLCSKEGSTGVIIVTLQDDEKVTEDQRLVALKEHWNGLVQPISMAGMEIIEQQEPEWEAPFPDQIDYAMEVVSADDREITFKGRSVFGERTYMLVVTGNEEEVAELFPVFDTFAELPAE